MSSEEEQELTEALEVEEVEDADIGLSDSSASKARLLDDREREEDEDSGDEFDDIDIADSDDDARTRFRVKSVIRRRSAVRRSGRALKCCLLFGFIVSGIAMAGIAIHRYGPKQVPSGNSQFSAVLKSPADTASYKVFKLENGIKVLLISDNATLNLPMAVSVNVDAGFFNEPAEYPGLAHFLEHMLFLGSEKYPAEGGYANYLAMNGGSSNAGTNTDYTNYYFHVNQDAGAKALDMLAQFFISPTLSKDGVAREVKAVDSEFRNSLSNDAFRRERFLSLMSSQQSQASRFAVGSVETLNKPGVLTALRKFFKEQYTSDRLSVAVWSTDKLENLEQLVRQSFSAIPKTTSPEFIPRAPFPHESRAQMGHYGTINGDDTINVYFQIEPIRGKERRRPVDLIVHLLAHEANGTVLAKLRHVGWATALRGYTDESNVGYALLTFTIQLTVAGKEHNNEIIGMLFDYLRLIQSSGITQHVWNDMLALDEIEFEFNRPFTDPTSAISGLARRLGRISSPADLLSPPSRSIWDPEMALNIVKTMTPDNVIVLIGSSEDAGFTHYDPLYAFNFTRSTIGRVQRERWQSQKRDPFFKIPGANPYVPDIKTLTALQEQLPIPAPELLVNVAGKKLWWYPNPEFPHVPKVSIDIALYPDIHSFQQDGVAFHAHMTMWLAMVNKDMDNETFNAQLAGFSYQLSHDVSSLHLTLTGYADVKPLRLYLTTLLQSIFKTYNVHHFRSVKHEQIQLLSKGRAVTKEKDLIMLRYNTRYISRSDRGVFLPLLSMRHHDLLNFVSAFTGAMTTVGFIHGSLSRAKAKALFGEVSHFHPDSTPVDLDKVRYQQLLSLQPSSQPVYHAQALEPNTAVVYDIIPMCGSCDIGAGINISTYAGAGCSRESLRCSVLALFLNQLIDDACLYQLRTTEQLGYTVFCRVAESINEYQLAAYVQSPRYKVEYIERRIQAFLASFSVTLKKRLNAPSLWARLRSSVRTLLSRQEKSFEALTRRLRSEIYQARFQFDMNAQLLSELEHITDPMSVVNFYNDILQSKRQLSIQIYNKEETSLHAGDNILDESSLPAWRRSHRTYVPLSRVSYGI
eukprot:scpid28606/ scgid26845/ Insulin-degrading enzyme; Insulin protease; Insulysin